ncbi:hypothetical protein K491DRAFT_728114 [Lophiostoma macrostomum CBS 122681]|uniref:Uncharacterized protein n=1 Tax=Lophiostoma macrostomum CBS 122681 TaxID=1314788 RepID=A0A6A6SZB5_9PLEO|nr:hypothetical protein K491DRAFT_728114 [Lophiostoma macrostomum CBS 122681]
MTVKRPAVPTPWEIAIINITDRLKTASSTVNYGVSLRTTGMQLAPLTGGLPSAHVVKNAQNIYHQGAEEITQGLTPFELRTKLQGVGLDKTCTVVAWACNYNDFYAAETILRGHNAVVLKVDEVQPSFSTVRLLDLLRFLTTFQVFGLKEIYTAMYPRESVRLWHTAEVDAYALAKIVEKTLELTSELIK